MQRQNQQKMYQIQETRARNTAILREFQQDNSEKMFYICRDLISVYGTNPINLKVGMRVFQTLMALDILEFKYLRHRKNMEIIKELKGYTMENRKMATYNKRKDLKNIITKLKFSMNGTRRYSELYNHFSFILDEFQAAFALIIFTDM